MPKVIPKNAADEMTRPYIDDAVDKQLKAADVPPRNKLDISFKDAGRTDDNKDYESNQDAYEKNHGKLYEMTHSNTIPWKNYVVYIVLLSLLTCVFTFSKYMSNAGGVSTVAVAKFNVVTEGSLDDTSFSTKFYSDDKSKAFVFDENTLTHTFSVKVSSTSDVSVEVNVSQLTENYGGTWDKETETLPACTDDNNPPTATFTYTLSAGQLPSISGLTATDGYFNFESLQFNVRIDQVD